MREELLNDLKPAEKIDWQDSELRLALVGVWQVVKWVGLGLLAIVAGIVWLIMSIVFAEVNERK